MWKKDVLIMYNIHYNIFYNIILYYFSFLFYATYRSYAMAKTFLPEITYMRGLCMLGVIGIHVGSYALQNPLINTQLLSVLEIVSRFSIPTFFFLSAFGLFYHTPTHEPFHYKDFLKRRLSVVLVPYIVWSILYTVYGSLLGHTVVAFLPQYFVPALLFGTASYQLYFLVIIIWFYLFMPLWRYIVKAILPHPIIGLVGLFIVQTIFNYWSSYQLGAIKFSHPALQFLLDMRLNYWVLHYAWVFILGAVIAERYDRVKMLLWQYRALLSIAFVLSVGAMLGGYYYVMGVMNYTRLEAIYTIHQLSPMGMFYTGAAALFFLHMFQVTPLSPAMRVLWDSLGKASYGMYLIHPFILYWTTPLIGKMGYIFTSPVVIVLYLITVIVSYGATTIMLEAPKKLRKLLLGA